MIGCLLTTDEAVIKHPKAASGNKIYQRSYGQRTQHDSDRGSEWQAAVGAPPQPAVPRATIVKSTVRHEKTTKHEAPEERPRYTNCQQQ